jgi:hypothetical protein
MKLQIEGRGTYDSVHQWLKYHYGKASKCEGIDCWGATKRFNWALRKGFTYKNDRSHFIQLCGSCHIRMDASPTRGEKLRKAHTGKVLSIETRKRMSLSLKGKGTVRIKQFKDGVLIKTWESIVEAANELKVNSTSIIQCAKGKTPTIRGFTWEYDQDQIIKREQGRKSKKCAGCRGKLTLLPPNDKDKSAYCEKCDRYYTQNYFKAATNEKIDWPFDRGSRDSSTTHEITLTAQDIEKLSQERKGK